MLVFQKQTNSPNSNDLATSFNKTFGTSFNFDKKKYVHRSFLTPILPFSSFHHLPSPLTLSSKERIWNKVPALCVLFYGLSCFQTNHPQSGLLWLLVMEAGIRTLFVVPGIVFNKLVFVVRTRGETIHRFCSRIVVL